MRSKTALFALALAAFFAPKAAAQTDVFAFSDRPVPLRKGKKWGLAHPADGRVLLEPTLDSIGLFDPNASLVWAKKGAFYGLVNRLGEVVLPFAEAAPLDLTGRFHFTVLERPALGAKSLAEENDRAADGPTGLFRQIAFFDSLGRAIGQPFEFENMAFAGERFVSYNLLERQMNGIGDGRYLPIETPFFEVFKNGKAGLFDLKKGRLAVATDFDRIILKGSKAAVAVRFRRFAGQNLSIPADYFLVDLLADGRLSKVPDSLELRDTGGFSETRFLAKNRRTGRFGFLKKDGSTALDFAFFDARPFSKNGLALVQKTENGAWSAIDTAGREVFSAGPEPTVLIDGAGDFWAKSLADSLFRKVGADPSDRVGSFGLDAPPILETVCGRPFFRGWRRFRQGFLDTSGAVVLPFEFDQIKNYRQETFDWPGYRSTNFLWVEKDGRKWLVECRTMQPVAPNLLPETGLFIEKTFEKSNFDLLEPLWGDSLFLIRIDKKFDVLNARSGRRWFLSGLEKLDFWTRFDAPERVVRAVFEDGSEQTFWLEGRPCSPHATFRKTENFGFWSFEFDPKPGLTTVRDSARRELCRLKIPFAETGNDLQLVQNSGGSGREKFVLIARAPSGRAAVFSLAGRRLSPKWIWNASVEGDLIFAEMWQKQGVFDLKTGKKVLPCAFKSVWLYQDELQAVDFEGTETQFDRRGRRLFSLPKGFQHAAMSRLIEGRQKIWHQTDNRYGFMDAKKQLVFSLEKGASAKDFQEGLALVFDSKGRGFYVDSMGRTAIAGPFSHAEEFENGAALVSSYDGLESMAIDRSGRAFLSQKSLKGNVWQLSSQLFAKSDGDRASIFDEKGQPVLLDCECLEGEWATISNQNPTDWIVFSNEKYSRLRPGGTVLPFENTVPENEFGTGFSTIEKSEFGNLIEKTEACGGRGFRFADGSWAVAPRPGQLIERLEDSRFLHIQNGWKNVLFDLQNRKTVELPPFNRIGKVGAAGWLLQLEIEMEEAFIREFLGEKDPMKFESTYAEAQAAGPKNSFLYAPDFSEKKPWPPTWVVNFDESSGCYFVKNGIDDEAHLIGFFARDGRQLFSD